jgi:AraC family ethanolamine operon transcriptional activator
MLECINQKSLYIEELSAIQFGWGIEFTQLSPADKESTSCLIKSINAGICHFRFNSNFDQRLHAHPGYYSFGLPDPGTTKVKILEKAANSGSLVVLPHNNEAYGSSYTGFQGYGIHIKASYLEAIAESIFRRTVRSLIPIASVYMLTEAEFNILLWELDKWQEMAKIASPTSSAMLEHREEALAIAVLNSLNHSSPAINPKISTADLTIRHVLDYIHSTPLEDITALQLCTIADCSQRWLEQCFKVRFGVTPKAYVKYLRLSRLRKDLLQSHTDANQKIIDLASIHGFWHMGQLAADYRKVYGELPSNTLQKG